MFNPKVIKHEGKVGQKVQSASVCRPVGTMKTAQIVKLIGTGPTFHRCGVHCGQEELLLWRRTAKMTHKKASLTVTHMVSEVPTPELLCLRMLTWTESSNQKVDLS